MIVYAVIGDVLAAGGFNETALLNLAEVYSIATGTWTPTGSLNTARDNFQMVRLDSDNILAAGGTGPDSTATASAEVWSPTKGIWTPTGQLNAPRQEFQMVRLANGNILAAGGNTGTPLNYISSSEIYTPAAGTWTTTGSLSQARDDFQMVLLPNGNVLAAGGSYQNAALSSSELYNPTSGIWTTTGSLNVARLSFEMVVLANGNVLAVGGSRGTIAAAEIYNPTTGIWTVTGSLNIGRAVFRMVVLPSGNVLAAGGSSNYPSTVTATNSSEIYNPATGIWTLTGAMMTSRQNFGMTLLSNGNVLALGGMNTETNPSGNPLNSSELYNPVTRMWAPSGSYSTEIDDPSGSIQMVSLAA